MRLLAQAVAREPDNARVVLMADGLDLLQPRARVALLDWLPQMLPARVRVVLAATHSDLRPFGGLERARALSFSVLPLLSFTEPECRALLSAVPALTAKTLDAEQKALLLANPATRNPGFLCGALAELKGHGSYETLSERIRSLPQATAADDETAQARLWRQVIERLLSDFDRATCQRLLMALACSRNGMSAAELAGFCPGPAEEVHAILRQMSEQLIQVGACVAFRSRSFNEAVCALLLPTEEERRSCHAALAQHFHRSDDVHRRALQTAWHLAEAGDFRRLAHVIFQPELLDSLWEKEREALLPYAARARDAGVAIERAALAAAARKPEDHSFLFRVHHLLADLGYPAESLRVLDGLKRETTEGEHRADEVPLDGAMAEADDYQAHLLNSEALARIRAQDFEGAAGLLEQAAKLARRESLQASIWGNQAVIHQARGRFEEAKTLMRRQEAICRRLDLFGPLCSCLGNLAVIQIEQGDFEGARVMLDEKERLCQAHEDLAFELQILHGQRALWHEGRGDLTAAARAMDQKLAVCRRNGLQWDLDNTLRAKAEILEKQGDLEGALACCEEARVGILSRNVPQEIVSLETVRAYLLARQGRQWVEARGAVDHALALAERDGLNGVFALRALKSQIESATASALAVDVQGYDALREAAAEGDLDEVRRLHEQGVPLEVEGDAPTPLHGAAASGNVLLVDWLLDQGVALNPVRLSHTPLIKAIGAGQDGTALRLIARGGAADVQGSLRPALCQAAMCGRLSPLREMLQRGADIEAFCADPQDAKNALMYAAKYAQPEIARELLQAGANPNARNWAYQRTALMYAAAANGPAAPELVQVLLESGADPFLRCSRGYTAADYGTEEVRTLLYAWRPAADWLQRATKGRHNLLIHGRDHHLLDSALALVLAWKLQQPAAYGFIPAHVPWVIQELVAAAHSQSEDARRITNIDWYCASCAAQAPEDGVYWFVAKACPQRLDTADPPPVQDQESIDRFVADPRCPACGHGRFVLLNTDAASSRAEALARQPRFLSFLVDKLKELGFWAPELDEAAFLRLDLARLVERIDELAAGHHELPDGATGEEPNWQEGGNHEVFRYGGREEDRKLLPRLADKARFGHPIAAPNLVIQRWVNACAARPLVRCLFLAAPFIWQKNVDGKGRDWTALQITQAKALENLVFRIASRSQSPIGLEDVLQAVATFAFG